MWCGVWCSLLFVVGVGFVVCCLLVVCCSLSVVRCSSFVVRCSLFVVCRLLFVRVRGVRRWSFVVCCLLYAEGCSLLLFVVRCRILAVCC